MTNLFDQQPAEQKKPEAETDISVIPEVETVISGVLQKAQTFYPEAVRRASTLRTHLSKVTAVETKEQDEAAATLLSRAAKTLDPTYNDRLAITGVMDNLKKHLMIPEKMMAEDIGRVKALRDGFAQKELEKQREEEKKIQDKKNLDNEAARITGIISVNYQNGVADTFMKLEGSLIDFMGKMTLENFEESEKKFNAKPKLRVETYESWFNVQYNPQFMNDEQFKHLVTTLKGRMPYETVNEEYVKVAQPKIDEYKAKLPDRKKVLQDISDADEAEKQRLQDEQAKLQEQQKKELEQKTEEQKRANESAVQEQQQVVEAQNEFESTVALNNVTTAKGVRRKMTAWVKEPDGENIVVVMSKLLMACFQHPKFTGVYEKEENGELKLKDGKPVPTKWAGDLLKFYAENCDETVEGIELKEVAKTTVSKK